MAQMIRAVLHYNTKLAEIRSVPVAFDLLKNIYIPTVIVVDGVYFGHPVLRKGVARYTEITPSPEDKAIPI